MTRLNQGFCKPRPVPFALRAKVEDELDRMQEAGIIRHVDFCSEWGTPIVPVLKSTGAVSICGNHNHQQSCESGQAPDSGCE